MNKLFKQYLLEMEEGNWKKTFSYEQWLAYVIETKEDDKDVYDEYTLAEVKQELRGCR